jgi:plasmid stabilization system protein ParE
VTKIVWTDAAIKDLEHIHGYISSDSETYANALILDILISVDRLEMFPKSGRTVPEIGKDEIREVLVGSYRIIYDIKQSLVRILTVIHGARKL